MYYIVVHMPAGTRNPAIYSYRNTSNGLTFVARLAG